MSDLNESCHAYMTIHSTTVTACRGVHFWEERMNESYNNILGTHEMNNSQELFIYICKFLGGVCE